MAVASDPSPATGASANAADVRPDWLALVAEEAIDPGQPVIDAHHHVYDRAYLRYLLPEYLADLATGHGVRASVFVQARTMLRAEGPAEFAAVGETEFVNGVAAASASGLYGPTRVCAGIVGFADLTLGDTVGVLLERQITAGGGTAADGGRFRGIRQTLCWDDDAALLNPVYVTTPDMMDSARFRAGFASLARLGLSFDAWAFFPQAAALTRLADAFPETAIIVNHCGGIVRTRGYADRTDVHARWLDGVRRLAERPNVSMKLSGLGMRLSGFGFHDHPRPPGSAELADAWRPWVLPCLESFGPTRCMWGSNFPVDKAAYSFGVGVNAFKRLVADLSAEERDQVLRGTAARVYRLPGLTAHSKGMMQ